MTDDAKAAEAVAETYKFAAIYNGITVGEDTWVSPSRVSGAFLSGVTWAREHTVQCPACSEAYRFGDGEQEPKRYIELHCKECNYHGHVVEASRLGEAEAEIARLKGSVTVLRRSATLFTNPNAVDFDIMYGVDDSQLAKAQERIKDLEIALSAWQEKWDVKNNQSASIRAIQERDILKARIAELEAANAKLYAAHKEWTRNDCRTFGDLLLEQAELNAKCARYEAALEAVCRTTEKDYPFIRDIQREALRGEP